LNLGLEPEKPGACSYMAVVTYGSSLVGEWLMVDGRSSGTTIFVAAALFCAPSFADRGCSTRSENHKNIRLRAK